MKCTLRRDALRTWIDVDGKCVEPFAYMSYCIEPENIAAFKAAGGNLFMFPVYAGDEGINMESGLRPFYDNFFKGYGKYDFSVLDRLLSVIAPAAERGIYVIPRVCVEPPLWWQRLNPGECARDHRGETLRQSYTSEKWRADMMDAVRALIDHIENSVWRENVIGYHIACGGTEEWAYQCRYNRQFYDDSEVNLAAYRTFVAGRYADVRQLSEAWGRPIRTWEDVTFPKPVERLYAKDGFLRSWETEASVLDYYDFHNAAVAQTIAYFCRGIKDYTHHERLCGAFYGYVVSMPHNKKGLHALGRLFYCPDIDFLSTTNQDMRPGAAWCFSSAVQSARLHGKLWMSEGDVRTCLTRGLSEKLPHAAPDNDYYGSAVWQGPQTLFLSLSALKKALARTLCAPCGMWWFDMFGGWFADRQMMQLIGKGASLYRAQKRDLFCAQIALIVDEKGYKYFANDECAQADAMCELSENLAHCGAPFDIYLQSDLSRPDFPASRYRLFIFSSSVYFDAQEQEALKKLRHGGAVLLWLYASGHYNPDLCGFTTQKRERESTQTAVFEGEEYPRTALPLLRFEKEEGYVLARLCGSGEASVLWRDMGDWQSVYCLHLPASAALLRHIALLAGVHLYNLDGSVVYAGGEFIALHAVHGGYERICLPYARCTATNALTGEPVTVNDRFIDLKTERHDTIILHISCEQART